MFSQKVGKAIIKEVLLSGSLGTPIVRPSIGWGFDARWSQVFLNGSTISMIHSIDSLSGFVEVGWSEYFLGESVAYMSESTDSSSQSIEASIDLAWPFTSLSSSIREHEIVRPTNSSSGYIVALETSKSPSKSARMLEIAWTMEIDLASRQYLASDLLDL